MLGELETLRRSPLHMAECLRVVDEILDSMDERGLNEIMEGTELDVGSMIDAMLEETFAVMFTGNRDIDFAPRYTERLSESIEETLRVNNLTYFITSVMPDFQLNMHHIEWGDLVMHHKKLCVEAARGHGKCLGVGTMVRMYNGELKRVEDLSVGDSLMGIDSKPRVITALHTGTDKHMYKFHQSRGDDFVVNSKHTQTFIHVSKKGGFLENRKKHIVDIDMQDFLSMTPNTIRETIRTFKVACDYPERNVLVDPYYLGIWLGDGYSHSTTICKPYKEIVEFCDWYANKLNIFCDHDNWNENLKCYSNHIFYEKKDWCEKKKRNIKHSKLFKFMKAYHLLNNKHIPDVYLHNSKRIRMRLLAGLIDSDGDYWSNGYHYSSINKHLVEQIKDLADSLGFRTSKVLGGVAYSKQLNRDYESYGITISGKIDEIPVRIKHKQISYDWFSKTSYKDWGVVDGITPTVISSVKVEDIGPGEYVCITTDGDKRFLLADGTVTHNSYYFSNAYIAWQLYRYKKPKTMQFSMRPTKSSSNRGFLFSFSLQQSVDLIEIIKGTIESNDILAERLMPQNTKEGAWASTNITCRNGSRLTGKGFGSSVRGAHPYFIVVDDGLKDNVIYSSLQRQKSIDYFHSVIMNMIIPGGQTIVVGTPFHAQDLYGDLKTKKGWFVIEYPAIFPNGKILWPQRFSYQTLMDMRSTQGNIIFSRENLCRPIVSDASIFSLEVLRQSIIRMDNYCLVRNRDDFPRKFDKVVVGADFAISSAVGADFYCYTVFGVGEDNGMWLLWMEIGKGRKYDEQLQILRGINARFRPDVMVFESNVFQQIFSEGATDYGMPVVSHQTGTEKNDLSKGWCALAIMFERGLFHIPTGDDFSVKMKDMIFDQLGSVAFTDQGLQSVGSHDDICSSMWLATLGRNLSRTGSKFIFI